jgi:phosphoglycolate phosphatase-like HAD superfamily hydrolase
MKEIELVIFDMAGTTVEERGQVHAAFKAAFVEHGLAISSAELSKVRGTSKREAVYNLLPEELTKLHRQRQFMPRFVNSLNNELRTHQSFRNRRFSSAAPPIQSDNDGSPQVVPNALDLGQNLLLGRVHALIICYLPGSAAPPGSVASD